MVVLPTKEDFSQASGLINYPFLNSLYEGFMDKALLEMGRQIVIHLQPAVTEDKSVSTKVDAGAYNPFFRNSSRISSGGKGKGVVSQPRDIGYTAHVVHGPRPLNEQTGAGALSEDQVQTTTVYESLGDIESAVSVTIDGNRYRKLEDPRIVGFSDAKYVLQTWERIAETEK